MKYNSQYSIKILCRSNHVIEKSLRFTNIDPNISFLVSTDPRTNRLIYDSQSMTPRFHYQILTSVHGLQVWTLVTSGTVDALYHPSCRSLFFSLSLAKGGHTFDPRRRPHEFQGSMRRCTKTPALLSPFSISLHSFLSSPLRSYHPASSGGGGGGGSSNSSSLDSGNTAALSQLRYRHQHELQDTLLPTPVLRRSRVARW